MADKTDAEAPAEKEAQSPAPMTLHGFVAKLEALIAEAEAADLRPWQGIGGLSLKKGMGVLDRVWSFLEEGDTKKKVRP